tara:strand:- start:1231 stop:2205 length:975 start_codon:yes stop_codon:yes gene_type:complete
MKPNKYIIFFARKLWFWGWSKLMNGFAPSDKNGNYKRPYGLFLDQTFQINFQEENILYLLVGASCPWCHRTLLSYQLQDLSNVIKIIFLKPDINEGRWVFKEKFYGYKTLREIYKNSQNTFNILLPETLPLLVLSRNNKLRIISNESAGILKYLNSITNHKTSNKDRIYQSEEQFTELIHRKINNGVYKCGFARNQKSYLKASSELFNALDLIESKLEESRGPWLYGKKITIADIYLFPTMIRWELIYNKLFKCSEREISDYKHIMKWRLNFYNYKDIEKTCLPSTWVEDYYKSLFPLNPSQIVPVHDSLRNILEKGFNHKTSI